MVKRRNETAENEKVRIQRANYSDCVLNVKKCNVIGTVVLRLFCFILIRDISGSGNRGAVADVYVKERKGCTVK